jgi:hypothetical protein
MMAKNNKPAPLPLAQNEPGPPTNLYFQIAFKVTNAIYQGPGFVIPPGCTVTVEPVNGTGLNAQTCFVAPYSAALGTNSARPIVQGTGDVVIPWPVGNLSELYCTGTEGDGLLIKVTGPGIQ